MPQESPFLEEYLEAQRYDIGFTETHNIPTCTVQMSLLTCNEVYVLPPRHPLCQCQVLTPQDSQSAIYVSMSHDDIYRQLLDRLFHEQNVKLLFVLEIHS